MKVIIMCAGRSKRFGTHKPKPLSIVEGITNVERTWNQVYEISGVSSKITVNKDRKGYFDNLGLDLILGESKRESQRFSNASPLDGETVFLYGDVIYSDEDLTEILGRRKVTKWYGRIGPNSITGKQCDELMGVHIIDYEKFMESVWEADRQFKYKERKQVIGWDIYDIHEGLDKRMKTINFIQLSDYSDDFDTVSEYKNLLKVYSL